MSQHRLLSIHSHFMSAQKAEEALDVMFKRMGISPSDVTDIKRGARLLWNNKFLEYRRLLKEMREEGRVSWIETDYLESGDPFFGGTFAVATNSTAFDLSISYMGFSAQVKGPGSIYQSERELCDDILFFRQQACEFSYEDEFKRTSRFYRAYLSSCIAIVEAFVNRHILFAEHRGMNSPDLDLLKNTTNLESKIELWLKIFTKQSIAAINQGVEWDHFQQLRRERNNLLHVNEPYFRHSIREMCTQLNLCKLGIGALLREFRARQGLPSLSFINRLENAPVITFSSRR